MIFRLLDRQAQWLREAFDAEAQLRIWVLVFWLCLPLYLVGLAFWGRWLEIFIFWLSVNALHLTAMTGITAAETLVEARNGSQEANGGRTGYDRDPRAAQEQAPPTSTSSREEA